MFPLFITGNVLGNYEDILQLLKDEQQLPSQYTPEKQNKEAIDSSSKAAISTTCIQHYIHHDFPSLPPSRYISGFTSEVDEPKFHEFQENHHQYQSGIKRPLSSPSSTHVTDGLPLQDIGLLEDSDSHSSRFTEYAVKPMAYPQSNLKHLQQLQ